MPRVRKIVTEAPAKEDLQGIARQAADAQSDLKKIEAMIEKQVNKIRAKYQPEITKLQELEKEALHKLEAYVLENRSEFDKKRSRDLTHGIIGLRVSTPSVKIARGLASKIVGILEESQLGQFIRTKKELDKEAVLRSREDQSTVERLTKLGVTIEQKEAFYFQPKEELIEA